MLELSYLFALLFVSVIWLLVRVYVAAKQKRVSWKREAQLMLVYICIVVVRQHRQPYTEG